MDVEAHITGTVWKIEVGVGDEVSDGDTVVILESMKMEMPVEIEDDGVVKEIRCEEGQSVQEGDVLVVLECTGLASGKLILDRPAEAVARLTLNNPEKRNPLDHEVLDAIASTLPELADGIETRCVVITGTGRAFSAGYDIGAIPEQSFEQDAEALVAHPFHAAMEAISAHPYPVVCGDQRPLSGRRPGARGPLRSAHLRRRREARDAAGEARPDLRAHRARAVHRRRRRRLHPRALPHRAQPDAERAERIGLVNWAVDDDEVEPAALELAAEIAADAPLAR